MARTIRRSSCGLAPHRRSAGRGMGCLRQRSGFERDLQVALANPFISPCFSSAHWKQRLGHAGDRLAAAAPPAARTAAGSLSAAMPCYLKSHSYGEYVFDHAWADAYERAGGSYYPKLQAGGALHAGHRPAPARRRRPRPDRARGDAVAGRRRRSPSAWTPPRCTSPSSRDDECELAGGSASCSATTSNSIGANEGYGSFEDFLAALVLAQAQEHPQGARRTR